MRKVVIKSKTEAVSSLVEGGNKLANIVRSTLGPYGRNVAMSKGPKPLILNDGKTIAQNIFLEDEIENLGVKIIREATQKTSEKAGDGTTRATVITQAIMNSILEGTSTTLGGSNLNVMEKRREIMDDCEKAVKLLNEKASEIKTREEMYNVAFTSSEDEQIANLIADAFEKMGKGGTISVEEGSEKTTKVEMSEGYELENGFGQYSFMANKEDLTTEMENPYVLVTDRVLRTADDVVHIYNELQGKGIHELVIVAKTFGDQLMMEFLNGVKGGTFDTLGIKAPLFRQGYVLKDLATVLGATFISERTHTSLKDIGVKDLGRAQKVIAGPDLTVFIGPKGDINGAIAELRIQHDLEKSEHERVKIKERIAKLGGKIARIKIGANSRTETEYLKIKVQNSINSTRLALEEGVVRGGGIALKEIAEEMKDSVIYDGLISVNKQIQDNAGKKFDIPENIWDPLRVERVALETACSLAGIIITIDSAIEDKTKNDSADKLLEMMNNQ